MVDSLTAAAHEAWALAAAHLGQWDGWAVLLTALGFGARRSPLWSPLAVALVINPAPYGLVAALVHGRHPGIAAAGLFTLVQCAIACAGYALGRLVQRVRR